MNNKSIQGISLTSATLADYPTVQNMARFYVYDLSRSCGFTSDEDDWTIPRDGLYESTDFKNYFIEADKKAYLVKIQLNSGK
ncbi:MULTISPECIES: hypothetical protein [unclassified Rickettsia]|uniref:hypothetical protein n=1 Tax=unclassified Rickettsia TaxID=114295 RepID=UPI0031330B00